VSRIILIAILVVACSAPVSPPSSPSGGVGLWIANDIAQTGLVELGGSRRIVQPPDLDGPKAIAFDASGNLWVSLTRTPVQDTVLPAIFEYTVAQLDSAAPTPHVTIADTSLTLVGGLAFDSAGDLWVASVDNCAIVEYRAGQFTSPSLELTRQCQSPVIGPQTIAFDARGNLWVGDLFTGTIYEYPRAVLATTGTVTTPPAIIITLPSHVLPAAIAFDGRGNLWVVSNDSTVIDYTTSTTLSIPGTHLVSLAFDASGNLWLANFGTSPATSTVDELSAAQLGGSGVVTPVTVIRSGSGTVNQPTGLAFRRPR
jgi:ligand-binding sensor domain-containing protein